MILLIDNYDSFSYNVVQLIGKVAKGDVLVKRNDEISVDEIREINPRAIVISPGPGKPKDAGVCKEVVEKLKEEYPILGICLGHQCICEVFGGEVTYAKRLMHGKESVIDVKEDEIFKGLENGFSAARYHSLSANEEKMPECLEVIAKASDDGEIMAVKHKNYKIYGFQFHPESVLTPDGEVLIKNFLKCC